MIKKMLLLVALSSASLMHPSKPAATPTQALKARLKDSYLQFKDVPNKLKQGAMWVKDNPKTVAVALTATGAGFLVGSYHGRRASSQRPRIYLRLDVYADRTPARVSVVNYSSGQVVDTYERTSFYSDVPVTLSTSSRFDLVNNQ